MRPVIAFAAALALASFPLAGAIAGERTVMVELFTSQGCSSCPPADKFMEELSARPGIVALTLPVDIWDYLGWRDNFAKPEFTTRQQTYAPLMPSRSIYTPQMVIGGSADVVGSRRDDAQKLIETMAADTMPGTAMTLALNKDTLDIDIAAAPGLAGTAASVWLARVRAHGEIEIGGGENIGKTIAYSNVVRELTPIGVWKPERAGHFEAPARTDLGEPYDRLAVFIQKDHQGPILAAALIDLPAP